MIQQVHGGNFVKEVLENEGLVLVDFYGPGCASCRALAPVIDKLSDKVKAVKVDISSSDDIANFYRITSVPTILFFKNGDVVETLTGVQSKSKLLQIIEDNK